MSAFEPFRRHSGIAAPFPFDNVDTDAIFPAQFIRRMDADYAGALFANWRFRDGVREEDPEFILNREPYRRARILVAGDNFGCGSSREHAVWALKAWGIHAVIARSFGDIFYDNCFKNGVLAVRLDTDAHAALLNGIEAAPGQPTTADLEACELIAPDGEVFAFKVDAGRRQQLLQGLDDIALTLQDATAIEAFQERQRTGHPWIWSGLDCSTDEPDGARTTRKRSPR